MSALYPRPDREGKSVEKGIACEEKKKKIASAT